METIIQILARELDKSEQHVANVVTLLDEGNTIPFIARYRKELHGSMDDTALRALEDRLQYLRNLAKRREEVKGAIESQGKLTEELAAAIGGSLPPLQAEAPDPGHGGPGEGAGAPGGPAVRPGAGLSGASGGRRRVR